MSNNTDQQPKAAPDAGKDGGESPELVAAKLKYLLRDFGPVRNDECASHVVKLAIAALQSRAAPGVVEPIARTAEKSLAEAGVFKGAEGLRQFAECTEFWDQQLYGTRFYFDGNHYLHRDILRAAIRALGAPPAPAASAQPAETFDDGAPITSWGRDGKWILLRPLHQPALSPDTSNVKGGV